MWIVRITWTMNGGYNDGTTEVPSFMGSMQDAIRDAVGRLLATNPKMHIVSAIAYGV